MRIEHLQDRQKVKRKGKENEKNWMENREGKTTVTFLEKLFSSIEPSVLEVPILLICLQISTYYEQ